MISLPYFHKRSRLGKLCRSSNEENGLHRAYVCIYFFYVCIYFFVCEEHPHPSPILAYFFPTPLTPVRVDVINRLPVNRHSKGYISMPLLCFLLTSTTHIFALHYVKSVCIRSFSDRYFRAFGLNSDRYSVSLRIQFEFWKLRTRKTPNTDTFHAVLVSILLTLNMLLFQNMKFFSL